VVVITCYQFFCRPPIFSASNVALRLTSMNLNSSTTRKLDYLYLYITKKRYLPKRFKTPHPSAMSRDTMSSLLSARRLGSCSTQYCSHVLTGATRIRSREGRTERSIVLENLCFGVNSAFNSTSSGSQEVGGCWDTCPEAKRE
jgi:hypothetical protein